MPRRGVLSLLPLLVALAAVPVAGAANGDETRLAERFAPVVRLVAQDEECGYGEPYAPLDVDQLFGEPTVGLRGPWGPDDLVSIGPTARELSRGLYEYHLDFPGNALDPGCDYERWNDRLAHGSPPTVYAHVAFDEAVPDRLALQYWFFYSFNDFNNKHEGDWEMVQLVFDTGDAADALSREPVAVGYTQHEGAEQASWDDEKLELVDGTHPVVHPAAGSHANYYEESLYLGRSAEQGVGCDDTSGPTITLRPVVRTIPSDAAAAAQEFPWIAYEGRWGELQQAFYNGPTGPNLKRQWTEPIRWSEEEWRDRSYAIPTGGLLGTGATDFFCSAVAGGSDALRRAIDNAAQTLFVLALLLALLVFLARRTTWRPGTPLRVARRRAWGQILASAARMYVTRWRLFVAIGLVFIPITLVIAALQTLLLRTGLGVGSDGESEGAAALLALMIGTLLTITGLALVQAATAKALTEVDAGREIGPVAAYRLSLGRHRTLFGALVLAIVVVAVLGLTIALVPVAVWLAVRWSLVAQVTELETVASPRAALRRSSALVRGHWLRVATLVVVSAALALALGPFLGAILIFVTSAPFAVLNIVAGAVYALAMPFVALTSSYVYYDLLVREALEPEEETEEILPAELGTAGGTRGAA